MKVLVTGATGFLGIHLCRELVSAGWLVTAMHRAASDVSQIQAMGVCCAEADLGNPEGLRRAVAGHDAVIHAAADIRYWSPNPEQTRLTNVAGTANVARACRLEKVGRMLYVSSAAAIGIPGDARQPADENFPFNLKGTAFQYHISKKQGEEAVLNEVSAGLDAVIVNPTSIFGPHGSSYRGGEMIRKVTSGRWAPYFRGGISTVHVADVVNGTLAALEQGRRGTRYILGGENISYFDIAGRTLDALHLRRPRIPVPGLLAGTLARTMSAVSSFTKRRPRFSLTTHYLSSRHQYYCSDRARSELGYQPRDFNAILAEFLSMCSNEKAGGR